MSNCTDDSSSEMPSARMYRTTLIVWSITIVLGVSANFFIIMSFCKVKLLRVVTNYFIVNLAVADIFFLVAQAVRIICELSDSLSDTQAKLADNIFISIEVFCLSASLTSLACVSVDRCLAITVPLRYHSITTHSRALTWVFTVWAYSIVTFVTSYSRNIVDSAYIYEKIYISCLFTFTFTLPILITTASYYRIFRAVWRQLHHLPKHANPGRRVRFVMKEFRLAINILVTILPAYFFWGSFWVITLIEAIKEQPFDHSFILSWLLGIAPHFAAAVNPLIYISMTRDFRLLFLRLFACKKHAEEFSFVAESRQRTMSLRSCSIQQNIPLVDVLNSDEVARSLTTSEDSKSSNGNGQYLSTDSSCIASSPLEDKSGFASSV